MENSNKTGMESKGKLSPSAVISALPVLPADFGQGWMSQNAIELTVGLWG